MDNKIHLTIDTTSIDITYDEAIAVCKKLRFTDNQTLETIVEMIKVSLPKNLIEEIESYYPLDDIPFDSVPY